MIYSYICPNFFESDSPDVLQATSVMIYAYVMKIDSLSNAKVIDRAVKFVDIHSDLGDGLLIDQNLPHSRSNSPTTMADSGVRSFVYSLITGI